jgi:hypothetical protein
MTAGSLFFDNNSVYGVILRSTNLINLPESFNIYTINYTIEFWMNCGVQYNGSVPYILSPKYTYISNGLCIGINNSGQITCGKFNITIISSVKNNLNDNTWHNIAITYDYNNSRTFRIFIDGVLDTTVINDFNDYSYGSDDLVIGGYIDDSVYNFSHKYTGYISNLRIISRDCLYTKSYTLSYLPYEKTSNTLLLLNTTIENPFIDSSNYTHAIETTYFNYNFHRLDSIAPTSSTNIFSPPPPPPGPTGPTGSINPNPLCFKEDTKILCFIDNQEKYIPIQNIKKGFYIKTLLNGYKKVDMIGKSTIYNPNNDIRIKDRLYICTNENYPELFEDLIITGCHCILIEEFKDENEHKKVFNIYNKLYITDNKYRIPAYMDEKASVYKPEGEFVIYHFALEHHDYYMNYGIFANGLLVESSSKRMMKEYSKMVLL